MDYAVVITTCGRDGLLERTLDAFDARIRPRPTEGIVVDDSGDPHYRRWLEAIVNDRGWQLVYHPMRRGFCETVADAWTMAARATAPWVFWLEDDFEIARAVDLRDLAHVLAHEPQVAQMALYRDPVNPEERAAGGYVPLHRDSYEDRGAGTVRWLETTRNWTTNPSLFLRDLAARHPWPGEESECEGKFGFVLREERPGTTFGIWGAGIEPHVRHIGERSGFGY